MKVLVMLLRSGRRHYSMLIFVVTLLSVLSGTDVNAQAVRLLCGDGKDCGSDTAIMIIDGEIGKDLPYTLKALLEKLPPNLDLIVNINSPGGLVIPAIEAGKLLRKYRARTQIGNCASACGFLFIGGSTRVFLPGDVLFLHRPSLPPTALATMSFGEIEKSHLKLREEIEQYIREAGVSREFIDLLYTIPINTEEALSIFEARRLRIAGMTESEFDFRKGQLVMRYGTQVDDLITLALQSEREIRICAEDVYQDWFLSTNNKIISSMMADKAELDCRHRAYTIAGDLLEKKCKEIAGPDWTVLYLGIHKVVKDY